MIPALLQMRAIHKRFDAVVALNDVHLAVSTGTVHAIIGENGAGKSTLMKILSGSLKPDAGSMTLDGHNYAPDGPKQASEAGINMIYQELTLAPHLTVEENITLGVEKQKFSILHHQWREVEEALAMLGKSDLDLKTPVSQLSIGQQQLVEIARALLRKSRIIIMDEPTSSLSAEDTQYLFAAINRLKQKDITIIYISHFLEEIQQIADDYTVLRDGENVASGKTRGTTLSQLVTYMVGRSLDEMFPRKPHQIGTKIFSAKNIHHPPKVNHVTFDLHSGEILGIAGLVGAGRTEMLRCIYGLDGAKSGAIRVHDKNFRLGSRHFPGRPLKAGMSMLSENRKEEGVAITLPIRDNISCSSLKNFADKLGRLKLKKESRMVTKAANRVTMKYNTIMDPVFSLSGGNQQKVALARILLDGSTVLLLDEPTRGIDVNSKVEIYTLIGQFSQQGYGIIIVSSYLPELFGICDSLAVCYRGTLSQTRPISEWTEESVMTWATTGKL
ncbi:sugar ABC transporter ATP-binding protein [candidate division KSB1 bacterium]|nr:sugar ABC transporter ATP-binding protein [candidate division KSB1 bacterium]RQW00837.1 MAG: sugar ABC transporter ATP-binding protein [candidate division KSB1 bacterium]